MEKRVKYHIWSKNIKYGEKLGLLPDFAAKRDFEPSKLIYGEFIVEPDRFESIKCDDLQEFLDIMDRSATFEYFLFSLHFISDKQKKYLYIRVSHFYSFVNVEVSSNDIDLIESAHKFIKETLALSNPEIQAYDRERTKHLQPTVFIGRHFDKVAEGYCNTLSQFLRLLGFDIKEGEPYASTDIPDKVKSRIDSQDIFICLVSGSREHPWLIAEPSYALGKDKHVIVLSEEETKYDATILGRDLEQIRFPSGQIEKTFIPLLQEFRSIRIKGL